MLQQNVRTSWNEQTEKRNEETGKPENGSTNGTTKRENGKIEKRLNGTGKFKNGETEKLENGTDRTGDGKTENRENGQTVWTGTGFPI